MEVEVLNAEILNLEEHRRYKLENSKLRSSENLALTISEGFALILLNVKVFLNLTLMILAIFRMDSVTHTNGFAIYVKEGFRFARDLSLEYSEDCLCFRLALLIGLFFSSINNRLCLCPRILTLFPQT